MRRVYYYLRDLVWPAVLSVAFVATSVVFVVVDATTIAGVFAILAVALAILSMRS